MLTAFSIDSVTRTIMWTNGVAPIAGNASAIDRYSFSILKTAADTYTILGDMTKFS